MGICCSTPHNVEETETEIADETKEEQKEQKEKKEGQGIIPLSFEDIVDGKHLKYMDQYETKSGEYWGIGLENESYLQWSIRRNIEDFCKLIPKRERYSVDYYKNFVTEPLKKALSLLSKQTLLTYPIFINSHTFQKVDSCLHHRTFYDMEGTHNPAFTESIHDRLLRECPDYRDMYDISVVFDGDTIEFITQDFYCATVDKAVQELIATKTKWLSAVGPCLSRIAYENGWGLPQSHPDSHGVFEFPQRNEGLVSFLTTEQKNLGICNTQTLHMNITLPTPIHDGKIVNKDRFLQDHLAFISMIQVVEPLIVASYGSPDPFSVVDSEYSIGSQRATRSRYISLQTYEIDTPVNGKLLLGPRPENPEHWYNRLVHSPYQSHTEIGYDVNFNKFKGHGVEIRFLDWFPEKYIKGLMDFFILLGAHASAVGKSSYMKSTYHDIILTCLRRGFTGVLSVEEVSRILKDMGLSEGAGAGAGRKEVREATPYHLLCHIRDVLYEMYHRSEIVNKMSPDMKYPPHLVNYNEMAFWELYRGIYGKRPLVIRAEASPFEARVPIVPSDIPLLLEEYRIFVESSTTRCFSDEEYSTAGAKIIPNGTWMTYPRAVVVGLKGLRKGDIPHPSQTLFHFAHCFKQQEGWKEVIGPLRQAAQFIDYEFMLDDDGKRTLSFCKQAGYVGGYLTLLSYYGWSSPLHFSEERMNSFLEQQIHSRITPRILVIGYGTVGRACVEVFQRFGLSCTVKRSTDKVTPDEILSYDIYVHAIRLMPEQGSIPPFLKECDVDRLGRKLTLITDLSCDLGHPMNPLPVYDRYGTKERPIQRIRMGEFLTPSDGSIYFSPPLDVLAVPYLPSFDPIRSSTEFSSECVWYMRELLCLNMSSQKNKMTRALARSQEAFRRVIAEAEAEAIPR